MTKTGMEEKMEEGKLYVAYGSNLSLTQMSRRCPTARVIGLAELMDYELLFRGRRENAFATVEPKQGSHVPVMIWRLQGDDELALDRYEGYPHLYEKKQVQVSIGREQMEAMIYVMTPGQSFGRPSSLYLGIIQEGYRNAGFDQGVLEIAVNVSEQMAMQEDGQQEGMTGMDSLR
nr:gamma-glutamylcyclotransferase family protein [Enterocloster bolteae]